MNRHKTGISLRLRVPSHLKKFAERHYQRSQFWLNASDPLGVVALRLLSTKDQGVRYRGEECLDFLLSVAKVYKVGVYWQSHARGSLTVYLDWQFKHTFYQWVDYYVEEGEEIQYAIEKFRQRYQLFEDDISTDALQKGYYRYRQRLLQQAGGTVQPDLV